MAHQSTSSSCASDSTQFSPTRTHATWKPRVDDADIALYHCARRGSLLMGLGHAATQAEVDLWRSVIVRSPYGNGDGEPCATCGDSFAQPVTFHSACAADEGFSFVFTGGMNANRLTLTWTDDTPDPAFVALKTFTGLQVCPSPRDGAVVFHLADEDAYCYCDLDPCEWCVARCKRGFKLYVVHTDGKGLRFLCENPPDAAVPTS